MKGAAEAPGAGLLPEARSLESAAAALWWAFFSGAAVGAVAMALLWRTLGAAAAQ